MRNETIAVCALVALWLAYFSVAIVAVWRQRSWWRVLPLGAALSVGSGFLLPYHRNNVPVITMMLLAAVILKAWRDTSRFQRVLRTLSVFWFLWFALLVALQRFEYL